MFIFTDFLLKLPGWKSDFLQLYFIENISWYSFIIFVSGPILCTLIYVGWKKYQATKINKRDKD